MGLGVRGGGLGGRGRPGETQGDLLPIFSFLCPPKGRKALETTRDRSILGRAPPHRSATNAARVFDFRGLSLFLFF